MITFLYDLQDNLITDLVNTAILNPDIIKIKNRLLDGTYHVQSIGERLDSISVICYVNQLGKEKLDNHYVTDTPIKLVKEDKFYIGTIERLGEYEVFIKGELYQVAFKIMVMGEGSI